MSWTHLLTDFFNDEENGKNLLIKQKDWMRMRMNINQK